MNKPLAYIIDLDGTLYDNSHRQHLIPEDRSNTTGWVEFNCACADDVLREDMADLVRSILLSGREAIFLTGRGTAAREQTMQRLLKDFNFVMQPDLIMRPMDWHTSAADFKRDAVERIWNSERWADYHLIALEDDPSIVAVMRGMGVTVLQIDSKCCALQSSGNTEQLDAVPGDCSFLSPDSIGEEMKSIYSDGHQVIGYELRGERYSVAVGSEWNVAMASFRTELKARIAEAEGAKIYGNRIDDSLPSPVSLKEVDTAPAQFESLAGERVSKPYTLPTESAREKSLTIQLLSVIKDLGLPENCPFVDVLNEIYRLQSNSPVIQDGWVMVPAELTPRMITKLQQNTEIGSHIAANWSGAYGLFQKFWDEAIAAAPVYSNTSEGWIACSERMPEPKRWLALYGARAFTHGYKRGEPYEDPCVDQGYLGSDGQFYLLNWDQPGILDDNYNNDLAVATHWRYWELPAAPKQEVKP